MDKKTKIARVVTGSIIVVSLLVYGAYAIGKSSQSSQPVSVAPVQQPVVATTTPVTQIQPVVNTQSKPSTSTTVDPSIEITICKTKAKEYADNTATAEYQAAAERLMTEGYTTQAEVVTGYQFDGPDGGPSHPADYEDNYDSVYLKCLGN